jgi:hypothetical protein
MRGHLALRQGTPSPAPLIYDWMSGLNASKKSMRYVPRTELEMDLVQKASILLFVSVFRRAFRI